ncbi:MAG: polysaccharide pyruvyl transferase family protein [Candidatus Omnitrophica bacterium]|nr:polysaccharide pyruvyl transferase family protein [Candidatus Omnitrophota bacterium]
MNFLIIGGFSCGNPGDEAILKNTLYSLNDLFPRAFFRICTDVPDFRVRFDRPVDYELIYWTPLAWTRGKTFRSLILTKLYTDFYPFSRWLAAAMGKVSPNAVRAVRQSDKVIFVGGGYLSGDFYLLEMNVLAAFVRKLGKPFYLLGQTLGPFEKDNHRKMANEIFEHAQKIVLRDSESSLEVARFKNKVWRGVDDALPFSPRLLDREKQAVDKLLAPERNRETFFLGINLRRWPGAGQYYPEIAEAISSLAQSLRHKRVKIIFIPMETSRYCDDRREAETFSAYLSSRIDFVPVNEDFTVEQRLYLVSRLDLLIGMRFHSLVFALASGVPAIGLYRGEYYFRKISGLFESFRFRENMLSMERIGELGPLLRATLARRDRIRQSLQGRKARLVRSQHALLERLLKEEEVLR